MPPKPGQQKNRGDALATMAQVTCWKQRLEKEAKLNAPQLELDMAEIGDLNRKNDLMYYYRPSLPTTCTNKLPKVLFEGARHSSQNETVVLGKKSEESLAGGKKRLAETLGANEKGGTSRPENPNMSFADPSQSAATRSIEQVGSRRIEYTIDKINDTVTKFDAKARDDTMYPPHEMQRIGFKSSRPLKTSQQYGWYAPLDQPKFGFERTRICEESFMDKSHL